MGKEKGGFLSSVIGTAKIGDTGIDLANSVFRALVFMEGLGEDATGFKFMMGGSPVKGGKNFGTTEHALRQELEDYLIGLDWDVGLGQNYKSPDEKVSLQDAGPIKIYKKGSKPEMAISFDGCTLKHWEFIPELKEKGYNLDSDSAGAVVGALFHQYLEQTGNFFEAGEMLEDKLEGRGYYSTTMIIKKDKENHLVGIRSDTGTAPLCIGKADNLVSICSESNGLDANKIPFDRFVEPGEMVVVSKKNGLESKIIHAPNVAECVFRGIYFGSPDSFMFGLNPKTDELVIKTIFELRKQLGLGLAKLYPNIEVDHIGFIPDSGKGVGTGFAEGYERQLVEFLIKNRHLPKTYNIADPLRRLDQVSLKFNAVRLYTYMMRLLACDDSIVKGSVTAWGGIEALRNGGAKWVGLLISYATIFFRCITEMYNFQGRAAEGMWYLPPDEINKKISKKINADAVFYNTPSNIPKVFGKNICMACVDGNYPVNEIYFPDELRRDLGRFRNEKNKPYFDM